MKKISILLVAFAVLSYLFVSCDEQNMDTFGSNYVYLTKDTSLVKLADTLSMQAGEVQSKDSTVKVIGVYRSGVSVSYPAMTVRLKVDEAYVDSMLAIYNDASISLSEKSDKVLYFKNTVALPSDCYTLTEEVTVGKGSLYAAVPVQLNLKNMAKLDLKKYYVIPITLESCSRDTILQTKRTTILKVLPMFKYKTIN